LANDPPTVSAIVAPDDAGAEPGTEAGATAPPEPATGDPATDAEAELALGGALETAAALVVDAAGAVAAAAVSFVPPLLLHAASEAATATAITASDRRLVDLTNVSYIHRITRFRCKRTARLTKTRLGFGQRATTRLHDWRCTHRPPTLTKPESSGQRHMAPCTRQ
jgi:hypothetical protein